MKAFAIAVCCALLVGVARPECVTVEAAKLEESSEHVRIAVTLNGEPATGTRVDFYQNAIARASVLTDEKGIATPPKLLPGDYNLVAKLDDDVSTSMWLRVVPKGKTVTLSMDLIAPYAQARQAMLQTSEKLPNGRQIQTFRGSVLDPSGAGVSGTSIRVVRRLEGEMVVLRVKADANGHFSGDLSEGSYVAFFFAQGFRTAVEPFEITKTGSGEVQVTLQVGHC